MEPILVNWGFIGIMEKNMETTIVYLGYIGIMEKKTETIGFTGILKWLYRGYIGQDLGSSGQSGVWGLGRRATGSGFGASGVRPSGPEIGVRIWALCLTVFY